ncbi:MAG: polyprenol monophosphomannose synthase [Micrococcales bacterium]|nr:polyprenol monophosphomannose synthase [Micrococcales bacterium]
MTSDLAALERVVVLVPTYNEAESLPELITHLRQVVPGVDVCIIDDNSPDGTGAIADRLAADDPAVHVIHRDAKQGLGAAYLEGFAWARRSGYDALVEMDADGSHRPEDLPRLLQAAADADVVIGSRWVPGGQVVNWPERRKALSLGANAYTRVLLGMPVRDATAGFRLYRAEALATLVLDDVASQGYCFQVDLTWRAIRAGLRVVEVPITFVERRHGTSKMSGGVVRESMRRVAWWGAGYRASQAWHAVQHLLHRRGES